ncbi:DNA primase family protein [Streptacidiphilus griseoplanus]|uniref:DNA primase family protein n=1 Tax=Peterkaempfera griseoplana TaxID=66896 RepID=UPI001FE18768|nr:DNA primase family protein [Peterkaempfera griseoplana]
MSLTPELIQQFLSMAQELNSQTQPDGDMSEDDLAQHALETRFGGNLFFSRSKGWATFPAGNHFWIWDRHGDDVTAEVQTMLRELRAAERDQRKAQSLGGRTKRDNVVSLLKGLPDIRYSGEWDAHSMLLATPNGIIDLTTGDLTKGTPGQRITRVVNVEYDPDAACPRWEKFLDEVFEHDSELPRYVQRLLGYGITGSNKEQCFAVLFGEGANGKSTLLTVLRRILGDHAATVPFDMFTTSGKARGGPDAELLVGARVALASETNRSAVLDSAAIKNATGGEEVTVNPKYRDPYTFTPTALILLASNYKPVVREQDNGTWRRIKLIPFLQRFEGDRRDPQLEDKLLAEAPGILAWLVRGAVEWHREGLNDPASIREAVQAYKEDSDPLAGFFPGVIVADPEGRITNADLWDAYTGWADSEGNRLFQSLRTLSTALKERNRRIGPFNTKGKRGCTGIRLADARDHSGGPGIFNREDV